MFASVVLGDLNDFIAPSQACTNPLFVSPKKPEGGAAGGSAVAGHAGQARLALESDFLGGSIASSPPSSSAFLLAGASGGAFDAAAAPAAAQPSRPNLIRAAAGIAKVSLNDCLACNGCVTSAETVLIGQQSTDEMMRALADHAVRRGT